MTEPRAKATSRSYDRVAARYLQRFEHELDGKPFDRGFLDAVAALCSHRGWTIDLGCGPGQIGNYLAHRGLRVLSLDLSLQMLQRAAVLVPGAPRVQADMRAVPLADESIEGIVAFYSFIHVPPTELADTLQEMQRVLTADGYLAITTHVSPPADRAKGDKAVGDNPMHVEEMLTEPVDLDFYFYGADRLAQAADEAGFAVLRCEERDPYGPDVDGAQTRRAYLLSQKSS